MIAPGASIQAIDAPRLDEPAAEERREMAKGRGKGMHVPIFRGGVSAAADVRDANAEAGS
jgi:hypothetical protein